ncbi:MAG: tyrosine-protein phosphatase [Candidatus Promineifilaceae bacterium]
MDNDARHLNWEGCYNIRDLGGLPLADGGQTRFGTLVRADHLGRLTEAGRAQLVDYGIRYVIDLRVPQELAETPSAGFDGVEGAPEYRNISLMSDLGDPPELVDSEIPWDKAYIYVLDNNQENYAAAVRTIATAEGPLVFHCHSGKDRTGMLAALLLDLAGVDRQAIAADYALSRERLWPLWEEKVAQAGGEDYTNLWYKPTTKPETMMAVFEHLDRVYGGTAGYLRAAGITEEELAGLRARLVE